MSHAEIQRLVTLGFFYYIFATAFMLFLTLTIALLLSDIKKILKEVNTKTRRQV
jgi:hypothetical protein